MSATEMVKASFAYAWHAFMRRPWFFVRCSFVMILISAISSGVAESVNEFAPADTALIVNIFDFFVVQTLLAMGFVTWGLKVERNVDEVHFSDLWAPHAYWRYLGAALIVGAIEFIGYELFVIPGLIASTLLIFAPFFVIDMNVNPFEAISRSYHLVIHHFWTVLLMLLAVLALNIVGIIFVGIGLLVTAPMSVVIVAHVYRTLSQIPVAA